MVRGWRTPETWKLPRDVKPCGSFRRPIGQSSVSLAISIVSFQCVFAHLEPLPLTLRLCGRLASYLTFGLMQSSWHHGGARGPITDTRPLRQWDYPFGWSPHQMLVWQGLMNYGYTDAARRLIYRWLFTITSNAANYNRTIPEKYDVVRRTHQVFVEYGNVGTEFSYITQEGFGWTNASYQIGLSLLPRKLRGPLNRLIPPEWIFKGDGKASVGSRDDSLAPDHRRLAARLSALPITSLLDIQYSTFSPEFRLFLS